MEKIENITECIECKSKKIVRDYNRGELTCGECGLVISQDIIDGGKDWRSFDKESDDSKAHAGPPTNIMRHDKGLPTEISFSNRDSYGKRIPIKNRAQIYRMRKWQRRIRISNATERNLAYAMSEIDRMSSNLSLPRIIRESSASIYRKAVSKNIIRGRSIEGVVAGGIYAACRQNGVPRTLDEIADASRITRKEIGRTYRFMSRVLSFNLAPTSPLDYLSRFCSELKLSQKARLMAEDIIKRADKMELTSGRGPTGVAAAAIYIASIKSDERRTQREVADIACVTEVTVRNRYKDISEKLGIKIEVT